MRRRAFFWVGLFVAVFLLLFAWQPIAKTAISSVKPSLLNLNLTIAGANPQYFMDGEGPSDPMPPGDGGGTDPGGGGGCGCGGQRNEENKDKIENRRADQGNTKSDRSGRQEGGSESSNQNQTRVPSRQIKSSADRQARSRTQVDRTRWEKDGRDSIKDEIQAMRGLDLQSQPKQTLPPDRRDAIIKRVIARRLTQDRQP